jgi:hypothetical protein
MDKTTTEKQDHNTDEQNNTTLVLFCPSVL